jgi:hypothetical protein
MPTLVFDTHEVYLNNNEKQALQEIVNEYCSAVKIYGPFNSAHEGWGILSEEFDELWDEIKVKDGSRNQQNMLKEARQVGAMAMRFIVDVLLNNKGFK